MTKGKGRRQNKTGRSETEGRHVRLEYWLLEHPAFLVLSANAKVTAIYMAKLFNGSNNGRIAFGVRSQCHIRVNGKDSGFKPFGLSKGRIHRALIELEGAGFIVCTRPATFDQKRLMKEWRLTWLANPGQSATKEFGPATGPKIQKLVPQVGQTPPLQSLQWSYSERRDGENGGYRPTDAPIVQSDSSMCGTHLSTRGTGGEGGIVIELPQDQNTPN